MKRVLLVLIVAIVAGPVAPAEAVTLPPGFVDEAVTAVGAPTALAFTPAGDMLITTQPGTLRVRKPDGVDGDGARRSAAGSARTPSAACSASPSTRRSRPTASSTSTTRSTSSDTCPTSGSSTPVNRVSRFTLVRTTRSTSRARSCSSTTSPRPPATTTAATCSSARTATSTSASATAAATTRATAAAPGSNDAARDRHVLLGKILRITPAGAIPSDNPYAATGAALQRDRRDDRRARTARRRSPGACATRSASPSTPTRPARAFTSTTSARTPGRRSTSARAGADYGWNVREGHCANGSTTNCGAPPAGMTNPIFDYGRSRRLRVDHRRRLRARQASGRRPTTARTSSATTSAGRSSSSSPTGRGGFNRVDVRRRDSAAAAPCTCVRPARHRTGAVLHDLRRRRRGAAHRLRGRQPRADRRRDRLSHLRSSPACTVVVQRIGAAATRTRATR